MSNKKVAVGLLKWLTILITLLLGNIGQAMAQEAKPTAGAAAPAGAWLSAQTSPLATQTQAPSSDVVVLLEEVRFRGVSAFAEATLQALVGDAIGTEQTFAELDELALRVTRYYRESGYPVARAYLPAQTIADGIVEIGVLEGRYGSIRVDNASDLRDEVLRRRLGGLVPGALIEQDTLDQSLLLLNDVPGIMVGSSLEPGDAAGESQLIVRVANASRQNGRITLDNGGNDLTGAWRGQFAFGYNNPFGLGDSLSLNAQLTEGGRLLGGRLGYTAPIGRQLTLETSVSSVQYTLGGPFAALDTSGGTRGVDLTLIYPLRRASGRTQELVAGLSAQNIDSTIANDTTARHSTQFAVGLRDRRNTNQGVLGYGVQLTLGSLDISPAAAKAADAASAQTQGSFTKLDVDFNYAQRINIRTQWSVSARGQVAGKNLDDSAKLTLGGSAGVRAYPPGEASGDAGALVSFDFSHAPQFADAWPGAWRLNAFLDLGTVKTNAAPWTGADQGGRTLTGAGFGLLFVHAAGYTANVEYACRLGNEPATSAADQPCRLWARLGVSF